MGVEGLNSNLYFAQVQTLAVQNAQAQSKEKTEKADKSKKKMFANAFEKSRREMELVREGFPAEIAEMDVEEAAIYLRDAADIAADVLREHQTPAEYADYRKKITQFMKFVVKNSYDIRKKDGIGRRRGDPKVKIVVINEKLDEMARYIMSPMNESHRKALRLLADIDEIRGLLVDLMAT